MERYIHWKGDVVTVVSFGARYELDGVEGALMVAYFHHDQLWLRSPEDFFAFLDHEPLPDGTGTYTGPRFKPYVAVSTHVCPTSLLMQDAAKDGHPTKPTIVHVETGKPAWRPGP